MNRQDAKRVNFARAYGMAIMRGPLGLICDNSWLDQFSDYPGGSKEFRKLVTVWTRDLDLGHSWTQIGRAVLCPNCSFLFIGEAKSKKRQVSQTTERISVWPKYKGKPPHQMRHIIRCIATQMIGSCDQQIVSHVMDT